VSASAEPTVSTVSSPAIKQPAEIGDTDYRTDLIYPCSIGQGYVAVADDADGADAKPRLLWR
jgi:hypothetical protein